VCGKRALIVETVIDAEAAGKLAIDEDSAAGLPPARPELIGRDQTVDDGVDRGSLVLG
jgi:hypothetical protein